MHPFGFVLKHVELVRACQRVLMLVSELVETVQEHAQRVLHIVYCRGEYHGEINGRVGHAVSPLILRMSAWYLRYCRCCSGKWFRRSSRCRQVVSRARLPGCCSNCFIKTWTRFRLSAAWSGTMLRALSKALTASSRLPDSNALMPSRLKPRASSFWRKPTGSSNRLSIFCNTSALSS